MGSDRRSEIKNELKALQVRAPIEDLSIAQYPYDNLARASALIVEDQCLRYGQTMPPFDVSYLEALAAYLKQYSPGQAIAARFLEEKCQESMASDDNSLGLSHLIALNVVGTKAGSLIEKSIESRRAAVKQTAEPPRPVVGGFTNTVVTASGTARHGASRP